MNQVQHPIHKIEIEEANVLASYTGYFQDLTFACDAFKNLLENLDKHEQVLQRSLWSAALIAYARCFSHGRRIQLTAEIYKGLEGDPLGCHQLIMGMRNKHIAHSVNPFEDISVGAIVVDKQVEGIAAIAVSHILADKLGIENLYRLTCVAREFVAEKCRVLQQQCLDAAKKMPIEEVRVGKDIRYVAPAPEAANQDRGKKQS